MFLVRFVSVLNRIKNKDAIATCFTFAMNTLRKEGRKEENSVKKKPQRNKVVMQNLVVKFS